MLQGMRSAATSAASAISSVIPEPIKKAWGSFKSWVVSHLPGRRVVNHPDNQTNLQRAGDFQKKFPDLNQRTASTDTPSSSASVSRHNTTESFAEPKQPMMPTKPRSHSSPAVPGEPGVPLDSPLGKAFEDGEDSFMTHIDKQRMGTEGYKQVQEDVAAFKRDHDIGDISTSFIDRQSVPELSRPTSENSTRPTSVSESENEELTQSLSTGASFNAAPTPQNTYVGEESSRTSTTSTNDEAVLPFTGSISSQSSLSETSSRSSQSDSGSEFSHIFAGKTAAEMTEQVVSKKDPDKEEKRMAALEHLSTLIKDMKKLDPDEVKTIRAQIDEFRSTKLVNPGPSKAFAADVRRELDAKIDELQADEARAKVGDFRDQLNGMYDSFVQGDKGALTALAQANYGGLDKEQARQEGLAVATKMLDHAVATRQPIGEEFELAIKNFQSGKTSKASHATADSLLQRVRDMRNEQARNEAREAHTRTLKQMGGMGPDDLATVPIPKDHDEKHDVRMAGLQRLQGLLEHTAMSKDVAAKYLAAADHFKSRNDKEVQQLLTALKRQIKEQTTAQAPVTRQIKNVGLELLNLKAKTAEELANVALPTSTDKKDNRVWKDTMQDEIRSRLSDMQTITQEDRDHYYSAIIRCTSKHFNRFTKGNRQRLEELLNDIPVRG
ncbi:hypothetical protein ACWJJH_11245 [Endozoicomonadaceae bacterium StTr2]